MSKPCKSKNSYCLFSLCMMLGLIASEANAQDFNDEMKKKLRESIIMPEKSPVISPEIYDPRLFSEQPEVLKVSPFTKLPTKFDRLNLQVPPYQEVQINLNTKVPIN